MKLKDIYYIEVEAKLVSKSIDANRCTSHCCIFQLEKVHIIQKNLIDFVCCVIPTTLDGNIQ